MGDGLKRVAKQCGGLIVKSGNSIVKYDRDGVKIAAQKICNICGKPFKADGANKVYDKVCPKCWSHA